MASIRTRVYRTGNAKNLDDLILRLEHPQLFLEAAGAELLQAIKANLAPHQQTGTLTKGFDKLTLYSRRGTKGEIWGIGIGDPDILTDWQNNAPPGTIGAFLRWVYAENDRLREKNKRKRSRTAEKEAKRKAEADRKRAQTRSERLAKQSQRKAKLVKTKSAYIKSVLQAAQGDEAAIEKLYELRDILSYRGYSFQRLGKLTSFLTRRYYKRFPQTRRYAFDFSRDVADLFFTAKESLKKLYSASSAAKAIEKYFIGKTAKISFTIQRVVKVKAPKPVKLPALPKLPKAAKITKATAAPDAYAAYIKAKKQQAQARLNAVRAKRAKK